MPLSLSEAKTQLLGGAPLSWKKFENHKAGSVTLESGGQRRLLKFLLEQPPAKVAEANEQLFPGIVLAWLATADPADGPAEATTLVAGGVWRLARVEASNFGGLTTFGGPTFDLIVGCENWCLEGQNGSGNARRNDDARIEIKKDNHRPAGSESDARR